MTTILLIDPQIAASSIVRDVVSGIPRCRLEVATDLFEGCSKLEDLQPRIVLISHELSAGSETIAEIKKIVPSSLVVVLSSPAQKELRAHYLQAGADAFLWKDAKFYSSLQKLLTQHLRTMDASQLNASEDSELLSMTTAFQRDDRVMHFRILDPIAEGGMGEIYKAEDTRLQRPVVLKVLPLASLKNDIAKQRLLREARVASALKHPNIVTIYSIEESQNIHFIVMEFLEGQNLGDIIAKAPLPLPEVLGIMIQVADALQVAHQTGLVHRDIKPSNIMVMSDGQAKLLDFGLAKSSQDHRFETLTASGLVLGTVNYMSPEQVQAKDLDSRTDLFSLGCVLYEAATGMPPFGDSNIVTTLQKIVEQDPPAPSTHRAGLPAELDAIVARALAKDRAKRYKNAAEMAQALRHLKQSLRIYEPPLNQSSAANAFYLKGCYGLKKLTEEHLEKAKQSFEQAILEEPSSVHFYIALAQTYNLLSFCGYVSPAETYPRARMAIAKALQLEAASAEAHAISGQTLLMNWNVEQAAGAFRRALELNPGCANAHLWYGILQVASKDTENAIDHINRALATDPLSLILNTFRSAVLYFRKEYSRSIKHLQTVLEMDSDFRMARLFLGLNYQQTGKREEAMEEFRRGIASTADARFAAAAGFCAAEMGQIEKATKVLESLKKMTLQRYVPSGEIALLSAVLKDRQNAFEYLEKACEDKSSWLLFLDVDPRFELIREDPKFPEIREKVFQKKSGGS